MRMIVRRGVEDFKIRRAKTEVTSLYGDEMEVIMMDVKEVTSV
jgi:hypothetical protein